MPRCTTRSINLKVPDYDTRMAQQYYDNWQEAERELIKVYEACDGFVVEEK